MLVTVATLLFYLVEKERGLFISSILSELAAPAYLFFLLLILIGQVEQDLTAHIFICSMTEATAGKYLLTLMAQ